jgi:peptide-methionine (S)-S-oxide reductase
MHDGASGYGNICRRLLLVRGSLISGSAGRNDGGVGFYRWNITESDQGHYEAVEVTYDAEQISYQQLLDLYWVNIDPFDARGQFCDKGSSYRSAIFVHSQAQLELAELSRKRVTDRFPAQPVVTEILPTNRFYPVESSHQDYYQKNPLRYRFYRSGCGRDDRLEAIWGADAQH